MAQQKQQKPWILSRHRFVTELVRPILSPYVRMTYGVRVDSFREQKDRQYFVLYNHQTSFDQFFVGMAMPRPVYYVATEDIFSLGWLSDLLRFAVAPIPIRKQTSDVSAIRTCIRVAKEGGTIAIAPEGNRTYSGRTEYINPSIVSLIRILKLPVALFRIEDGYGVQPRWSGKRRKGHMRAYVSEVIEPEEYSALSNDELYARITKGLEVNENCLSGEFHSKASAEYLDRAIYVCPTCGFSAFHSSGDVMACTSCGKQVRYLPTKELQGVGWDCPFRFVAEWYDHQKAFVNATDTRALTAEPIFRDQAKMSEVIVFKNKRLLRESAHLALYGDRVTIDEGSDNAITFPFDEISAAVCLGPNKLNLYHGDKVYQFKGDKHFNSLKYVNLFHRYQNLSKGDEHGEFLGL